ncbi:MAG: YicC family protein [Bacteroidaceae bacterium]|nr:YicC family protein [Bacteroidaceae bacterium]
MIQSMTGYGKSVAQFGNKKIHAEIKSLNSKALDLSTRIAPVYRDKEMDIRSYIAQQLERGKVEFNLWVEKENMSSDVSLNKDAMLTYYRQLKEICEATGIAEPQPHEWVSILQRMPDVVSKNEVEELSDEEWLQARTAVEQAVAQLVEFRKQEGVALSKKFTQNIENIGNLLASIEPFEKERVEKIRQRITDVLEKTLSVDYDKNRLEQEMIYYIEKLDINEEKQRLSNHLKYFMETMQDGHGQGKKLGFIAQEMGREINTTGSKSNHAEMQNIVVKMKDELEQIKEQVLNVM